MTPQQQQTAAAEFAEFWADKGDEKQEAQRFWIQLLSEVLGIENTTKYIEFEKQVKLSHTSFIDAYIPSTKVLIEQKGAKVDLHKAAKQSDGTELTPYQQAKRYADEMPNSLRPHWIVVCNFQEFLVYDLEKPDEEPQQIFLKDLRKEYYRLLFLADAKHDYLRREEELSLQAGALVGKLYDALIKQYIDPDEKSLRSLNILCVRLVFCLYAEDAGLFATRTAFEDYLRSFAIENTRDAVIKLFKALDTPLAQRDKYDTKLQPFPYVNGGLFAAENIEIPNFTEEIIDVICNHCAPFDWADISPTIFGAVFESTLNPDTRRKGGMHYTSVQNIHKVIDPLFLDDLEAEFRKIRAIKTAKQRHEKLLIFQEKLGSLTFLDPACGSGNFLTETYLSLRRLENKTILEELLTKKMMGQTFLNIEHEEFNPIKVHINQFYGIEINDFAVTVAKTALWIAESQMIAETENIIRKDIDFLPLTTNAFIIEGNALRMDWSTFASTVPDSQHGSLSEAEMSGGNEPNLFAGFSSQTDGERHEYDYIIGNPPFLGARLMSEDQKKDVISIFDKTKNVGNLDYVSCWYKKAAELMANCRDAARHVSTRTALVSTNSITQGEQVAILWKPLFEKYGVHIDFAYKTFRWDSESNQKAHVHCVIIGFSCATNPICRIFNADGTVINAKNINGYLLDAPNVFIESRKETLCPVSEMVFGSMPNDGGNFILSEEDKDVFIAKEPNSQKYIHLFLGAEEFINNKKRYCLWLKGASPAELKKMPKVLERVENVRKMRKESKRGATQKLADIPHLFGEIRQPENGNYLLVPSTSSERRIYIPVGFVDSDNISSNANLIIPNATLYEFGVITSSVHNAWMRAVAGRLKSDYRYSASLVYNNFPWPQESENIKSKIEQTAQKILDARALYPDSSLADLYDETLMPAELRKAHRENDKAVMQAYGFDQKMTESEIVTELFKLYQAIINK